MAPPSHHAVVAVAATQVLSHDRKSIVIETGGWQPIDWYMKHTPLPLDEDEGSPPNKRRKTSPRTSAKTAVSQSIPRIPLERATIDLYFPDTLQATDAPIEDIAASADFSDATEIAATLIGLEQDEAGARMELSSPVEKGVVLVVETSRLPPAIYEQFRHLAHSDDKPLQRRALEPRDWRASSVKCSLARSCGGPFTLVRLQALLMWHDGVSAFPLGKPVGGARIYPDYDVLAKQYPDMTRNSVDHTVPWQPSDFYDSVHIPGADDLDVHLSQFNDLLDTELYPFQKRALHWMLAREGVQRLADGQLRTLSAAESANNDIVLWQCALDADGKRCFVNHLQGIISQEVAEVKRSSLSGGLLAEEMGLGKTVELMALISSHRMPSDVGDQQVDREIVKHVAASKATLIITPTSILQQWRAELNFHAPHLRVLIYEGMPSGGKKAKKEEDQLINELCTEYDVVLATYNVLGHEVYFAEDPPDRNMRHSRRYERKRSPLVQIRWWRIALDEAQMVESGVAAAARVACRLPRVHSWAVTGTPLRKNPQDLHGLLIFLRLTPLSEDAKLWSHLITNHRHLFRHIFGKIALRHTKARVRKELRLPPQKRVVLTMPFTAVEQQQYQARFDEMCEEIGLNVDGSPKDNLWNPEDPVTTETMRSWLVRLRQTCLHPQVGGKNKRALGRGQGPLRTVSEVLEAMIEKVETSIRVGERAVVNQNLLHAHIVGNNREDDHRSEKAFEIYQNTVTVAARLVSEARLRLATALRERKEAGEVEETTDDEAELGGDANPLLGRLRNGLRTALQLQHTCIFFAATACYQIKSNETLVEPNSQQYDALEKEETDLYDQAKLVRREILREASRRAEKLMRKLVDMKEKASKLPNVKDLENLGGIENRRISDKADQIFDVIRGQGATIVQWRAKMADFLLKPLVDTDEGNEITGEEYEASTKEQDELYVYFDAMKTITADLKFFVAGEDAPLIDHEAKMLVKAAKGMLDPEKSEFAVECHAPETVLSLYQIRNSFRAKKDQVGSVRGLIQEARALESSMQWTGGSARTDAELGIVQRYLHALNNVFNSYTKALAALEQEINLFRSTQNQRLEFYRQLQELSDDVAPYKEELDERLDESVLNAATKKGAEEEKVLAGLQSRHRRLTHLRGQTGIQAEPEPCSICTGSIEIGVLTSCGHEFCLECLKAWLRSHRSCPHCRQHLSSRDFTDISYKPRELKAKEEVASSSALSGHMSHENAIYTDVDSNLLKEIKSIDLSVSYGTKIDTLTRHLVWLRQNDPGAKSIVFSQYREFLDVLGSAFSEFGIGYSRLGRSGAVEKFKSDPSIDCLLLDAKTDSSGLTLVNATHVFICEPLIQTAVELQAIARVHRIGQTRPTTVWMYLINDTVEESIYDISVARRLAHLRSRQPNRSSHVSRSNTPAPLQETALDAADSEQLQSTPLSKLLAAGKSGGELVGKDDLWQCLFGKAQKKADAHSVTSEVEAEVGRHLRGEAAEARRISLVDGDIATGTA